MAEVLTAETTLLPETLGAGDEPVVAHTGEAVTESETELVSQPSGLANLMTPDGLIMLSFAGLLDLIGWTLIIFALDDLFITDIIGTLVIGTWLFFRTGQGATTSRLKSQAQKGLKKLFTGKWSKFLTPIINEVIPWWGDLMPSWIITVYFNLTAT